jgi:hypothetical protein
MNLLDEEESLAKYVNQVCPMQDGLGCINWRKAFWKRIVRGIEEGIAGLPPDEQEVLSEVFTC